MGRQAKAGCLVLVFGLALTCCWATGSNVAPNVTAISPDQEVTSPVPASFTCTVDSCPSSNITWLHNAAEVQAAPSRVTINTVQVDNRTQESTLTLLSTTAVDTGTYTCSAVNTEGMTNMTTELQVLVAPVTIISPKPTVTVSEGNSVVVMCTATDVSAPTISWFGNGVPLSDDDATLLVTNSTNDSMALLSVTSTLNVTSVMRESAFATITCTASNEVSANSSDSTQLIVLFAPNVTAISANQEVTSPAPVSFNCTVDSYPPSNITWFYDGVVVQAAPPRVTISTVQVDNRTQESTLTLLNTTAEDTGTYTCLAENDEGMAMMMTELQVLVAPMATISPKPKVTVSEGNPAVVMCTATGVPTPTISWSLNGMPLIDSARFLITGSTDDSMPLSVTSTLNATSVMRESALATITCTASNDVGSNSSDSTQLIVLFAPNVTAISANQVVTSPGPVSFNCTVASCPSSTITWLHNEAEVQVAPPRVTISTVQVDNRTQESTLTLLNTTAEDTGNYTCSAVNSEGMTNMTTELLVWEIPSAPNGLEVVIKANDTAPVTAVISWMALMDSATGIPPGGDQTLRYCVEVSNSNSEVLFSATVDHPTNMVEAPNLPACETLTVSFTAKNLLQSSSTSSQAFMTRGSAPPTTVTVSPLVSTSHYSAGSAISLRCSWDTSVYYMSWYKNGVLIYEEDLAASSVLMGPPQGISVVSGYTAMMSTLTIASATLDDSCRYTCAVTCGAKGVEFGMIAEDLTDTADVFVYERPSAPNGLTVVIKPDDTAPVTAVISWMALMGSDMGIPPGGNQTLRYCVEVRNSSSAVLFSATVEHPTNMVEVPNLPACEDLTVSVTAKNLLLSSIPSSQAFMTVEPAPPTTVTVSPLVSTSHYSAGSAISLRCSWNPRVYFVAWYKNGMLIYEEDLAASSILMGPPQGISVVSGYTTMMSTLTVVNAALEDSCCYTCAVTCGAKGVEFGMIAGNLTDTAEVFVYEMPNAPNGLKVLIKGDDTTPVTAVLSWMALMGSATGIPPGGNQTLTYFVEVSDSSSAVLFSATVEHPTDMVEAPNLPACDTLTVSVTAENLFFNGTTASQDFMTVEPADPVVTLTPAVDPLEGNATDNVTLTCSWNSTVFYLVWFKDGAPLYSRDLVSGDTVDSTSTSVTVEVEGLSSTLTFSQVSDSGNYTCAVTCRAKDSDEEDIPVQFRATKEVLIFDVPDEVMDFTASVGFLSVTFTWTSPSFLGVPLTLDPADFIYYILDVRNDTDSVGGATVPHPTTTVMVNLTYPCEEYTATIFARNRQAGNGPPTMETFTLNETSTINVSLSPMEDPVTYLFRAASANNTIMLSCSWDAEAYYVAWLRDGTPFYGEDRVRGLQLDKYGNFNGTASVTTNFAARSSTLQVTDAFITDSANYTCAVTCRARQVVRGEVLEVSEEFSATREVLVLAAPVGLVATERRPTYLVVQWTAPPSPFSGNYRLTYGPLGGMMTTVSGDSLNVTIRIKIRIGITITICVSFNITGLQPFTNYRVSVQASNAPVVDYGPTLSGVFATLPEAAISEDEDPPAVVVPQAGVGSSEIVEIVIPAPTFQLSHLSHLWVVCIRNILPTTRNTAPDTAFPDNSTFGTYDNAEDNVPYVASEFGAAGIIFPHTFGVGNESEPNDFSDQYTNGPVMAGRNVDCFVRYFVSTGVMPMSRRRRRNALLTRQYDEFQSTGYSTVNMATLIHPGNFSVVIVDPSADSDPVTANFSWTALDNVTFGGQNITYTVTVSYQNGSEVVSQSIPHPSSSLEIPGLPACANLTATLVAERGNESSNGTAAEFMTSEPTTPPTVTVSLMESTSDYPAGSDISLQCSWNTSVYYVAWYKNGVLIYEEDLAASSLLMGPPQGISVDSNFTTMMSILSIDNASLDDSSNYTCVVTCGAKGVEFGMIAGSLQGTAEVFFYEPPGTPNDLEAVIKTNDTTPVTAVISWMALMDSATGIPPGGNQTLRYFVEVSNSSSAVLFSATVDHPTDMVESPNLPACENLTVSMTAENLFLNGTNATEDFMTVEPAPPTVTVSPVESMSDYQNGSEISLRCLWDTSVYYVAWYKNGVLIYEEDLATSSVLMGPPQGISVDSNFTTMMSNLTIASAALGDSGNYTCAVTCGAKGVAFGMIAGNLTDTAEVFVYEPPNAPNDLTVVIKADDTTPVTAVISWMALMDSATGIPPGGNQTLRYFVEVSNSSSAVLFSATVEHPTSMVEAPNLPACETLTVSVTAKNLFFNGPPASAEFMTVEPAPPTTVTVSPVESTSDYPAGTNISLQCSWDTSVYYVAWYKNGVLIYEEDLAASSVLMEPPQGISVDSGYTMMMSILTITSAALADSGNYTCAVTCGAKEVEFGMIAGNLTDTAEVFVYEPPNAPNGLEIDIKASDTTPVTAVISWMTLMENATGIPPGGNQTLRYFVEVSNSSSAVLFSDTVDHPTDMVEAPNLPACENLTVSVTAENLFFNGSTASHDFMTVEPADPVVTLTPVVDPLEGNATDNITLTCAWNSTVFYLVWFKDGAPLYSRDLVSGDTVDSTSASVSVEVEGLSSTLTFSQVTDSGNYTCAVTCRAKDSDEEDIPVQFRATKEVLIFDVPGEVMDFVANVGFLSVTFTWTLPSFLGVPPTLDPADFIYYILDVRNDTDFVGGATVPHPTTTVVVSLTYPCEEYTATIFARNRQAGNGPPTMETFQLNETGAVNVILSPTEDPVTYLFRAASASNTIMLSCSWDAEAYYVSWLRNGATFYAEDRVRGLQLEEYGNFNGTASVTTNFAARSSTLQATDAFTTDSANYTCAVTCRARQVVRGEVLEVSEEFSATREVLVLAIPDGLVATERRPTYLVVQWTAPPSPFSGNYRLTYGTLGGMMTTTTVSGVSLNITGLQPFTNYRVSVQASNAPVVDYGPTLSGVFPTLPEIPPTVNPPTLVVPQVGDGSSGIVEIIIPLPPFPRQAILSHLWVVCIRNILPTTRNTAPDTAFPDNRTFGTYDNAEDNMPYIVSEFGATGIIFPYTFGVGDESEPNDFPNQYRNGPVMAGRNLVCFVRYFVSTEVMPMARRRRDAIPNRQYDIFLSTGYINVNTILSQDQSGLIAGLVVSLLLVAILVAAVVALVIFIIYRRRLEAHGKHPPPSRHGSIRLRDNMAMVSFQAGPEGLSPNEVKHPVKVKLFEKHVAQRHRNSDHLFSEEYELLSIRSPSLPHDVGAEPYNVAKNRYANIHSADESRVKLQPIEGRPGSDYINANYIDGYKAAKAFLASQGPMVNTTHDFWRMVWEQNSHTIIMLTNVVEKTRVKCHQYWPEPVGSSVTLADLTVTLIDQQDLADMVIRTFHLTKEDCKEKRQIQQLHYTTWPDFGVPEQAVPILQLIGRVNELNPPDAGPIVTHCSAGVGRTGTLITIYSMIKMIEDVEEVDVFNYVLKMRSQRTYMVQTEKQYVFIHDALLKYLNIRGHEMPVKVLRKRYQALKEENPETGQNGIIAEFAKLENLSLIDEAWLISGTLPANTHKNRSKDVLPYDPYRVRLTMFPGVEGSDYINSTYMDGYQCRNQFILTQGPLDLTIFDFWRMIWETRASTIVMLCQLQENDFEQCARYWPVPEEGVMQYGAFLIETERVQEHASGFTIRDISITNTKHYSERRLLRQFQYTEWPDSHLPSTAANIIDLIGLILKSQIQHGKGPVVIHDSGSVGRSATFCALCSILERMKSERLVDIFTTVHAMRTRLPRAVCSTDLYQFLYQTSVEYLDSFDHYSNFE